MIQNLVRPNIRRLTPYSSARSEFKGKAEVFLDANESPYDTGYNRYPDPLQWKLKQAISTLKGIAPEHIFLGNGSDEAIDLLLRIFCEPGADYIITLPPTYGMYRVSADISNVAVKEIPLRPGSFQPDVESVLAEADAHSKLLFICSPNNPTGNSIRPGVIRELTKGFPGIVVVDEAYIDFSAQESAIRLLPEYPNLVVLQTFSKAWGMAGIRLGMAFASEEIIGYFNKVKPPYNINQLTQEAALKALDRQEAQEAQVKQLLGQRTLLQQYLGGLPFVERIYPSDANFLLVKVEDPTGIYNYLVDRGIIVRDRSRVMLCEGCLRITVGTPEENERIFRALVEFE
ncbi:histidinol-phosphate transaminase [Phaeodactylibacter sp.]|uniref:histidinol-phosphate transaminase n=1 Tax=Phaeodactylibacter sp. TaxID=1940289 RepID=UPI0025FFA5ED|nr:histidinol-phosphate transaminase [Phaeodactylibacter sp.]MCI4649065.1 histidinol-phosphate transaminase [Phaeodactylibacter sp.]MCI5091783.1 histidinol-phosphate transaminase [Phaeodactylibacter sp.]